MKAETVTIDLELFGAKFANMGSDEQAKFFKGLAKELSSWESNHQKQMQFAYIKRELKASDIDELSEVLIMIVKEEYLAEFLRG